MSETSGYPEELTGAVLMTMPIYIISRMTESPIVTFEQKRAKHRLPSYGEKIQWGVTDHQYVVSVNALSCDLWFAVHSA